MISRIRKTTGLTPTLANLPVEILDNIVQFLPQSALYALLLTNSNFIETAACYLYMTPQFSSTYRYAQFAYQVSHNSYYAEMVRDLDLSYFGRIGLDAEGEMEPMAGWREFKYRNSEMYYVRDGMSKNGASSHPSPSPFLKSFHRTRDLPIGGLCHALAACKRIRKINLSRLQLASDFLLSPSPFPSTPSPTISSAIPTTATSGLRFVSDVPKSFTLSSPSSPDSSDLVPIYADFVISHLLALPILTNLKLKKCLWLTTTRVDRLMQEAGQALVKVDFRDSGMQVGVGWTIKGSRKDVERKVGEGLGRFNRELYGVDPPPGLRGVP